MLKLSEALLNRPVLSLRTGGEIAVTTALIINPNNLKIEGWHCTDRFSREPMILQTQYVRDIVPQGIVVNDHESLAEPSELVRLKEIIDINFDLIGKPVFSASKQKVGKVTDFVTELSTFYIQKLYVTQPLIKSFSGGSLTVERNQIIEITNRKIVIQDPLQPTKASIGAPVRSALTS